MREWFRIEAAAKGKGGGEIMIYSYIGRRYRDENVVDSQDFIRALDGMVKAGPGDIHVRINSPGGDVGEGIAIYNAIRSVKSRVVCTIDSVAYSMASVIALAGRETRMQDTGQFMLHNPSGGAWGGEKEMIAALNALKTAKAVLLKTYSAKTGKTDEDILGLMAATTWMTAEEAKDHGFVDSVISDGNMAGLAAFFDAQAWADFYAGRGPMPMADGPAASEEAPEQTEEEGGGGVPETNGAETPEEERVMPKLTAKEIREACPGASAEFVLGQVEACESDENRGIEHVLKAHNAELAAQNATLAAQAQVAAEAAQNRQAPGVAPVAASGSNDEPEADPITAWEEAVEAGEAKKLSRAQAIRAVAVGKPELHKAYLIAHNAQHGRVI